MTQPQEDRLRDLNEYAKECIFTKRPILLTPEQYQYMRDSLLYDISKPVAQAYDTMVSLGAQIIVISTPELNKSTPVLRRWLGWPGV